jgi:dTMP kinase
LRAGAATLDLGEELRPLLACVTGLDGSGKSTQVDALVERLQDNHSVAVANIWDPVLDSALGERTLFERHNDVDSYLSGLEPIARMYFLCHAIRESFARAVAQHPEIVLLDAYWYKYYATEVAHGGDPVVLRQIGAVLPEPDVTFYLSISAAQAARRKTKFTGYETGFDAARSADAFRAFQDPALRELQALAVEFGWVVPPGDTPQAQLTDWLFDHLTVLNFNRSRTGAAVASADAA